MPCGDNAYGKRKTENDNSKIPSLDIGDVAFTITVRFKWKASESGAEYVCESPFTWERHDSLTGASLVETHWVSFGRLISLHSNGCSKVSRYDDVCDVFEVCLSVRMRQTSNVPRHCNFQMAFVDTRCIDLWNWWIMGCTIFEIERQLHNTNSVIINFWLKRVPSTDHNRHSI